MMVFVVSVIYNDLLEVYGVYASEDKAKKESLNAYEKYGPFAWVKIEKKEIK